MAVHASLLWRGGGRTVGGNLERRVGSGNPALWRSWGTVQKPQSWRHRQDEKKSICSLASWIAKLIRVKDAENVLLVAWKWRDSMVSMAEYMEEYACKVLRSQGPIEG